MTYRVLITEDIDEEGKEYLKKNGYEIKIASGISEDILTEEVKECDAILVRMACITKKIMRAGTKLKVISKFGVGMDNINVHEALRLGIQLTNSPESNKNTVAEYTMGLIIALAKNLFIYDRELREGNFKIRNNFGIDIKDKVLGIVGMGAIGKLVAEKAINGFQMKVIGLKHHVSLEGIENVELTDNLDYLLKNSDFVSLHLPLNDSTKKLIGRRELSIMKSNAFLINTARGGVVDNDALVYALVNNKIAGAAVDVFEGEVPSKDNPLLRLNNIIVTPHTAAHTVEALKRMSLHSAIGIHQVLSGKKPSWPVEEK
ncbi:hydroxyacid dehydrogenase [Clostridium sp. LBM24168]